jgi:hypothetical protein
MASAKTCEFCGHSRAAHTDGIKCALCNCVSRPRELVQETFAFRTPLLRPAQNRRKR